MKNLSIIIVNYNTVELLEKCLQNLSKVAENAEIIVIDNGSSDGSAEMVKQEFPLVKCIETTNNGLAAGYNLGLKNATGDYLLFLGTDAFPKPNTIHGLIDFMETDPKIGIATCKLILRDEKLDKDCHRGFPDLWTALTHFAKLDKIFPRSKIFGRYFLGWKDFNKPHEIDLCISHFMMVKKKVFDDIGLWDEKFFVYGEDVDFCYRAKQVDWKIMYVPQFEAVHYKGATVGIRKETQDITKASTETKKRMLKESAQAMQIFYEKHYKNKYPKLVTNLVFWAIKLLGRRREKKIA